MSEEKKQVTDTNPLEGKEMKNFFDDFVEKKGFTLTKPPKGDGGCEIDEVCYGWSWHGADREALAKLEQGRIWTVVEGGDDDVHLIVVQGYHVVNRFCYLVLDQDAGNILEEFSY